MIDPTLGQEVLRLTQELVSRPSVSPDDQGCQDLIAERLLQAGYTIERLDFGQTRNLFARKGEGPIQLMLNGHTDVVPPGEGWTTDPFVPTLQDDHLVGRGSADMKSGVAAMVVALERLARAGHAEGLALLLTSDEESSGEDGTKRALQHLLDRGEVIHNAFVAEPTSVQTFGDVYKPGRRGSVTLRADVSGKQGHVAYLPSTDNAAQRLAIALAKLEGAEWDQADPAPFPATQMHVVELRSGVAENVVPGSAFAMANWRNGTAAPVARIQQIVEEAFPEGSNLHWTVSAEAFLTTPCALTEALEAAIHKVTGTQPQASTGGGTSDARWFAAHGIPVAEFGLVPIRMHGPDESIAIDQLAPLVKVIESLCLGMC